MSKVDYEAIFEREGIKESSWKKKFEILKEIYDDQFFTKEESEKLNSEIREMISNQGRYRNEI